MGTAVSGTGGASIRKGRAPQGSKPGGWRGGGLTGGLAGCAALWLSYWGPSPRLARPGALPTAPPPAELPPLPPRAAPSELRTVLIPLRCAAPHLSHCPAPGRYPSLPPPPGAPPPGSFRRVGGKAVVCPGALRVRKPVLGGGMLDRERKRDLGSMALERGGGWGRLPPACTPQIR